MSVAHHIEAEGELNIEVRQTDHTIMARHGTLQGKWKEGWRHERGGENRGASFLLISIQNAYSFGATQNSYF